MIENLLQQPFHGQSLGVERSTFCCALKLRLETVDYLLRYRTYPEPAAAYNLGVRLSTSSTIFPTTLWTLSVTCEGSNAFVYSIPAEGGRSLFAFAFQIERCFRSVQRQ